MLQPIKLSQSCHEAKGSRFFAFLMPFGQFENFLQQARREHPKAVHFVQSSRILNEHNQIQEHFSDDGEPKGTSGMPTLKVLQGAELIECGLVVIRYFGGTLLGTGGLVRAYSQATKNAIAQAKEDGTLQTYTPQIQFCVFVLFGEARKIEWLSKQMGLVLLSRQIKEEGMIFCFQSSTITQEQFLAQTKLKAL